MAATKLANEPARILKEGTARARGREAQNASTIAARIRSKPSRVGWVVKGMGKHNVCEALVVEVQVLKSSSEATDTILRTDGLTAAWNTKEEKTP